MTSTKSDLRKRLKAQRQALSADEASEITQTIAGRCIDLIPWENIRSMHIYAPILKENEVDSWQLLSYVWENYPHIQTVAPALNQSGEYDSVVVTAKTKWQPEGVRIPRPKSGEILAADQQFDVIIVPMLGFDDSSFRLGHGKGWYDRFLATQTRALTIGLCQELGRVHSGLPHEPHDIALDYIVTEKTVIKNRGQ